MFFGKQPNGHHSSARPMMEKISALFVMTICWEPISMHKLKFFEPMVGRGVKNFDIQKSI